MPIFNNDEQQQIRKAVQAAEHQTSGQIRVCVEAHCSKEAMDRAVTYFHRLEMHQTKLRNGVLIYVATADRKLAIIGDSGINRVVPEDFWVSTKENMLGYFKQGDMVNGIIEGLAQAGRQLKKYFPHRPDGANELPDDIAFMNGN